MKPSAYLPWLAGKRAALLLAASILLGAAVTFLLISKDQASPESPIGKPAAKTYPGLDLEDPAASYQTLRYVTDTGGDEATRSQALVWLDEHSRTGQPLDSVREKFLLELLRSGGHPAWDIEYKLWLFNSAFNVLHHSKDPEPLSEILYDLAASHPHRTMRLYALQHIGVQREQGRLKGEMSGRIRTLLEGQTDHTDPEVAGSAIRLLLTWNNDQATTDPDLIARAIGIANDTTRPADVRITALHAAEAHALAAARDLAADLSQPVLLRKAAIALIGQHGGENDLASLETYAGENFRLAQAADPARTAIRHRLANPDAPQPVPF
jgi:hypothetical protein